MGNVGLLLLTFGRPKKDKTKGANMKGKMYRFFNNPAILGFSSFSLTKLLGWLLRVLLVLILPLWMCGCYPACIAHVYEGPERNLKDIAVVIVCSNCAVPAGVQIETIDGHKVRDPFYGGPLEFHLLPGIHIIDVRCSSSGGLETIYKVKPVTLQADLEPGHVYKITTEFLGWDPNQPFPETSARLGSLTFGLLGSTKGYWDTKIESLGTVEEVACSPGLLPNYKKYHTIEGMIGNTPALALPWKQLAQAHCPDRAK
jgi:hypothetical protein